jgi:hypothetical protein
MSNGSPLIMPVIRPFVSSASVSDIGNALLVRTNGISQRCLDHRFGDGHDCTDSK